MEGGALRVQDASATAVEIVEDAAEEITRPSTASDAKQTEAVGAAQAGTNASGPKSSRELHSSTQLLFDSLIADILEPSKDASVEAAAPEVEKSSKLTEEVPIQAPQEEPKPVEEDRPSLDVPPASSPKDGQAPIAAEDTVVEPSAAEAPLQADKSLPTVEGEVIDLDSSIEEIAEEPTKTDLPEKQQEAQPPLKEIEAPVASGNADVQQVVEPEASEQPSGVVGDISEASKEPENDEGNLPVEAEVAEDKQTTAEASSETERVQLPDNLDADNNESMDAVELLCSKAELEVTPLWTVDESPAVVENATKEKTQSETTTIPETPAAETPAPGVVAIPPAAPVVDVIAIDDDDDEEPAKAPTVPAPTVAPIAAASVTTDAAVSTTPAAAQEPPSAAESNTPLPQDSDMSAFLSAERPIEALEEIVGKMAEHKAHKDAPKTECLNTKCQKLSTDMCVAPIFVSNVYGVTQKPKKSYYVCGDCFDDAISQMETYCDALAEGKALLQLDLPIREEVVELSDDSDDEGGNEAGSDQGSPLPLDFLRMVEEELEGMIKQKVEEYDVKQQIDWTKTLMEAKIENNSKMAASVLDEFRQIERAAQAMNRKLYSISEPKLLATPALDIFSSSDGKFYRERFELPPAGLVERPPINLSSMYYAVRVRLLSAWGPCKVLDATELDSLLQYKISFIDNKNTAVKVVPGKMLAYSHPPSTRLPVGERVIALFNNADPAQPNPGKSHFFPGVIAEPLQTYNNFRYLVFFDDGYAQYVSHQDVRLVYEVSPQVWDDVHAHAKEFIQEYLKSFKKERPLVQVKRGQKIVTEFKGTWHQAKVLEADASLVKVFFDTIKRAEWIYRGSTRLGPLYREKMMSKKVERTQHQKRNEPSVEYVVLDEEEQRAQAALEQQQQHLQQQQQQQEQQQPPQQQQQQQQQRAVARKSTTPTAYNSQQGAQAPAQPNQQPRVQYLNNSTIILDDDHGKGRVVYYTARQNIKLEKFKQHDCNPSCLFKIQHNLRLYSPIAKPLLTGWERQIAKVRNKRNVIYRAPCGRRLRNIVELHRYLRKTKCTHSIDCFDYDVNLHCLAEYVVEKAIYQNPDISEGKEGMPVPCINYFDDTKPPPMDYSAVRIPTAGVNLNLDEEFLCGCDCTDGCYDKSKCACQQITIAGARYGNPKLPPEHVGYQFKRLLQAVPTGIYECNSRCKCNKSCLNRVVQFPLQNKLQVFKTNNRGWGLRAVNDIPKGTFICVYAGFLLTEEKANENGGDHGDEYFADLDYIEIAEQLKEGYESDAPEMSEESDEYDPEEDRNDDEDFTSSATSRPTTRSTRSTRNSEANAAQKKPAKSVTSQRSTPTTPVNPTTSDDEEDRERISLLPSMKMQDDMQVVKTRSLRRMYGKDENVYVMDAKISGNIGRYFNHCCDPNMFVQNVFVDTHDLRFPWIAFFASCYIRSGTELTWNYNYDVGSVPGKVLFCQCGAANCRQRLL